MPRELMHAAIALRAMDLLPPGALKNAARDQPDALLLGAAFHDVGYYQRGDRQGCDLTAFADRLHGSAGEDTFDILRRLMTGDPQTTSSPQFLAFVLGVATHIATDQAFHPAVYYLTGNYYDADPTRQAMAIEAHREFEVVLDFVVGDVADLATNRLADFIRRLGADLPPLLATVAARVDGENADRMSPAVLDAFRVFAKTQNLFRSMRAMEILERFRTVLPRGLRALSVLGYTRKRQALSAHFAILDYRNPVTGVEYRRTVAEMMDDAVQTAVSLCLEISRALESGTPPFPMTTGATLEMGLPDTPASQARFFHPLVDQGRHYEVLLASSVTSR